MSVAQAEQMPINHPHHRPSRAAYAPPQGWQVASVASLIAGTSRADLQPKQMDWINAVTNGDPDIPGRVFVAGRTELLARRCIAIIGARAASVQGRQRARQLAKQLAQRGVVIVSGLADGIDTEALQAAMDAGGDVVAVIGTPLDQAYPAKNKRLQEEIYKSHLLISQFPAGSRVYASAEADARQTRRGLWAGRFETPSSWRAEARQAQPAPAAPPSAGCVIKGNINAKGRRIFHVPGQEDYAATRIDTGRGERWFCSVAEAIAAGWTAAAR